VENKGAISHQQTHMPSSCFTKYPDIKYHLERPKLSPISQDMFLVLLFSKHMPHVRFVAIKNEKEKTLTSLLATHSEICVFFGFLSSWGISMVKYALVIFLESIHKIYFNALNL
jgi:hypothetical protein